MKLISDYVNVHQHGPGFVENHKLGKPQATIYLTLKHKNITLGTIMSLYYIPFKKLKYIKIITTV